MLLPKKEPLEVQENIIPKEVDKVPDSDRLRSGTWGAQTANRERDLMRKSQTRKEKEVRRSSDDRRHKRGKA